MTEANDPIFPHKDSDSAGLTKREYFACHILAGYAANREHCEGMASGDTNAAEWAVLDADALIDALNANSKGREP